MSPLLLGPTARADIAVPMPPARDAVGTDATPPPGPPATLGDLAPGLLAASVGVAMLLALVLRARRRAVE
jgi:hypothetical protein